MGIDRWVRVWGRGCRHPSGPWTALGLEAAFRPGASPGLPPAPGRAEGIRALPVDKDRPQPAPGRRRRGGLGGRGAARPSNR